MDQLMRFQWQDRVTRAVSAAEDCVDMTFIAIFTMASVNTIRGAYPSIMVLQYQRSRCCHLGSQQQQQQQQQENTPKVASHDFKRGAPFVGLYKANTSKY
eukprot:TRINITY_DN1750_c0_g1_i2.p1 TRINITY_DN1750_c0_g1~~TRINITY_DN1750_c0_g1_i2.p1  ORF type:complete len:100 (-),score=10.65 TRINITY_DN1750_c0_g1_i2:815-1114(-)